MSGKKPEKGRALGRKHPPKLDALPEEIAQVFFRASPMENLMP